MKNQGVNDKNAVVHIAEDCCQKKKSAAREPHSHRNCQGLFLCSYFAQDLLYYLRLQPVHYAMHGLCDGVMFGPGFRGCCNRCGFQARGHNAMYFFGLGDNRP